MGWGFLVTKTEVFRPVEVESEMVTLCARLVSVKSCKTVTVNLWLDLIASLYFFQEKSAVIKIPFLKRFREKSACSL